MANMIHVINEQGEKEVIPASNKIINEDFLDEDYYLIDEYIGLHLNEMAQMNPPEDELGDVDTWVYGESTDQDSKKEPHFHFCKDKNGDGHNYAVDIEVKINDG